jgi:hypothetical protein
MGDFTIVTTDDPSPYRERILSFWGKYLPETPPGRFDWMLRGNPAGPAVWFLALEGGTGELAGTTSLLPRLLHAGEASFRAGIMGDFMVADRYRAFGPYLKLLRETLGSRSSLGLDCIYTIPNLASRMPCLRAGMEKVKDLYCFARPLAIEFYLAKTMPQGMAAALGPFVSAALRVFSEELLIASHGAREEPLEFDASFDDLARKSARGANGLAGDRSPQCLTWRYARNPQYRFRLLAVRERGATSAEGFLVFAEVEKGKLEIYDVVGSQDRVIKRLIAALIRIGRRERCQALYFRSPLSSRALRILKRFRFFNTKDILELYYIGRSDVPIDSWDFMSGDRNI